MSKRAIQYTAVYNRKNKLNSEGKALVQIEAYKDAAKYYIGTGIYIKPANWDADKCQVQKLKNSGELNNRITELIERCKDIEFNRNRGNPDFSVYDLKQALENNLGDSFTGFAAAQLAKEKNLTEGTRYKYKKAIDTFAKFGKGNVTFGQLNHKLIDDFDYYLIAEGLIANTRKNYFKTLTKYSRLAVRYGMLDYNKNPFLSKKITKEKTIRHSLDDKELKKLENLKFTAEQKHMELIRDLFLMQCYTGLRFSDASRLAPEHIFETGDGMEIRMISKKENKPVNLPLHYLFKDRKKLSRPERLVKKYWNTAGSKQPFFLSLNSQNDEKANNQYVNRQLKDIQRMAGVQTLLTNHVGRHTFATYLVNRVPLPVVQELLQHSKVETTMIYIHVGAERVKEHLKKITDWI